MDNDKTIKAVVEKNTTKGLSPLEEMSILASKNKDEVDRELDHRLADELLLRRLVQLNETRLVGEYLKIKKWYA